MKPPVPHNIEQIIDYAFTRVIYPDLLPEKPYSIDKFENLIKHIGQKFDVSRYEQIIKEMRDTKGIYKGIL